MTTLVELGEIAIGENQLLTLRGGRVPIQNQERNSQVTLHIQRDNLITTPPTARFKKIDSSTEVIESHITHPQRALMATQAFSIQVLLSRLQGLIALKI